jgi:phosphate transport system substrate-binding protein
VVGGLRREDRHDRGLSIHRIGRGIAQIKAATVDFGASDAPLKPDELRKSGWHSFARHRRHRSRAQRRRREAGRDQLTSPLYADIFRQGEDLNDPAVPREPRRGLPAAPLLCTARQLRHGLQLDELSLKVSPR